MRASVLARVSKANTRLLSVFSRAVLSSSSVTSELRIRSTSSRTARMVATVEKLLVLAEISSKPG